MVFLNPLVLLGALGIALPILAHLLNKHQFKQTDWAAMQFLSHAINVRSRQIRLLDIFLLCLRGLEGECNIIIRRPIALRRGSHDRVFGIDFCKGKHSFRSRNASQPDIHILSFPVI